MAKEISDTPWKKPPPKNATPTKLSAKSKAEAKASAVVKGMRQAGDPPAIPPGAVDPELGVRG